MEVETSEPHVVDEDSLIVLTSEKRRGVYECDYCHSDISQQPRIRCAVCSDFDLCLDCFATSDHEAMIARIKASTQTQTELTKDGIGSTAIVVSSAAANHEADHKYRVCDSTRYPLFPTGRVVPPDEADGKVSFQTSLSDDPKTMWTTEEDLRLIDAIATHGLGNWVDISEAIGGQGSVGKTPKRCMERYLDDFLGRYGHVLPQYTIVDDSVEESSGTKEDETKTEEEPEPSSETKEDEAKTEGESEQSSSEEKSEKKEGDDTTSDSAAIAAPSTPPFKNAIEEEEGLRTSKRRSAAISNQTGSSLMGRSSSRKKLKVVTTESIPGYETVWPKPYLPLFENPILGQEAEFGKEVARDQSCKAEVAFVKSSLAANSKEEADKIRKTWVDSKLGNVGSPTVLPPRPQDAVHLLGSELAGFMPRRGDFDVEYDNDAETALADMEFIRGDKPEDKELKLKVLQIYCKKLDEREKRKKFVLERHLYDYRKYVQNDMLLPMDERDLVHRMRLFERFHTPDEHKKFIEDILKAKRLRKEIAKLQMYRRIGIKSLAEAETFELDKDRRQFHKKLEVEQKAKAAALASAKGTTKPSSELPTGPTRTPVLMKTTDSLWKQYRTSKKRRNSNRSVNSEKSTEETTAPKENEDKEEDKKDEKETQDVSAEGKETSEGQEMKTVDDEDKEKDDKDKEKDDKDKEKDNNEKDKDEPMADAEMADAEEKAEATEKKDDTTPESEEKKEEKPIESKPAKEFDLTRAPCRELLSRKELALCERQQIYPVQYLEIKKVLIHEALVNGLLDKETASSSKRTIVKVDVERRGNVVDFLVRAGWISRKLADVAMRVVTPQPS